MFDKATEFFRIKSSWSENLKGNGMKFIQRQTNQYSVLMRKVQLFTPRNYHQPGMVTHACNPALGRLRQKIYEFKASLGCISETLSQKTNEKIISGLLKVSATLPVLCECPLGNDSKKMGTFCTGGFFQSTVSECRGVKPMGVESWFVSFM